VRYVSRGGGDRGRLDLDAVEDGFAAGARTLFLTDLHNPTGWALSPGDLQALVDLAEAHGARVVVDEVYRDYRPGPVGTAYRPDRPVLVTASSLTKVYGLGALRAGWVFCPPSLRARIARLLDYLTVLPPSPVAAAAEAALRIAEPIRERGGSLIRAGRETFEAWMRDHPDVRWSSPAGGVAAFLTIRGIADTSDLCRWLLTDRDTAVVPGLFFGDASGLRLAFGVPLRTLEPALENLGQAIERFRP
jgi:aspartate/methionine/tyrosine aminotransferase